MVLRFGRIAAVAMVAILGTSLLACTTSAPGPESQVPAFTASPTTTPPTTAPTAGPSNPPTANPTQIVGPGPFTSPLYGYTVTLPDGWGIVTPATVRWPQGATTGHNPTYHDWFEGPSAEEDFGGVLVASQPLPAGMSADEWLLDQAKRQAASGRDCKGPAEDWIDAVVGSLEIRRIDLECIGGSRLSDVAFVIDGVGYMMSGNQVVLAQFLSTIEPGA